MTNYSSSFTGTVNSQAFVERATSPTHFCP
jgi:hypothetical protein